MAKERYLTTSELCDELTAHGIKAYQRKIYRWMAKGMPVHRPGGSGPYFLWSEVDSWIRSKWFDRPPGESDGDEPVEATG